MQDKGARCRTVRDDSISVRSPSWRMGTLARALGSACTVWYRSWNSCQNNSSWCCVTALNLHEQCQRRSSLRLRTQSCDMRMMPAGVPSSCTVFGLCSAS